MRRSDAETRHLRFWLRWSWRDLRQRWLLVCAIALVIALGTGMFTGLGSLERFRVSSNDASFALLHAHDLKVTLHEGSYVPAGTLERVLHSRPAARRISASEERLIVPTQVDASRAGKTVLVPGRIVGVGRARGDPIVDGLHVFRGRRLRGSDDGRPVGLLEHTFARAHDLPARGRVVLAGGAQVRYVGQGTSPEYFLTSAPGTTFGGEANFGVLFTPLATAQRLSGHRDSVNDAVLTLKPGADAMTVKRQLQVAFARRLPRAGVTITPLSDEFSYRVLYRDAKNDQRLMNVFALLILLGAALAAFNLASRVVEAERREFGIGMALGVPPRRLALRPLAMGAQIALLGVVFGVLVGLWVASAYRGILEDQLPLPVLTTPFEVGVFVRGAALGFLLPLVATALPIWRGLRVSPIDAIRVGFRSAKGSGLAVLLRRIPIPGRSTTQMPVRNVLRAPRRALMTLLAIGAVVSVVVVLLGSVDSFFNTIDRVEAETLNRSPDRLSVDLARFYPARSPVVRSVTSSPRVSRANPYLRVQGRLRSGREAFDTFIDLMSPRNPVWYPRVVERSKPPSRTGIVIAQEAARDLEVQVGDRIRVRYAVRTGPASFRTRTSRLRVTGLHDIPMRTISFMDPSQAGLMNLAGSSNGVSVVPARGVSDDRLKRSLTRLRGVVSVRSVSADTQTIRKRIEDFIGFLRIPEAVALILALLIAFNSSSINADERARENATMFAFGLPIGSVLRMSVLESLLIGMLGTLVGLALGVAVLSWVVNTLYQETLPEVGVAVTLTGESILTAALVGVLATALAPVLTLRRLLRMDVPSTLRVVE